MKKTAEWHEARRLGIGGSDANIIMGGDNDAILRLWREKRGESESEDLSWVLPVQIGSVTEELNARWFEHDTGLPVTDRNTMLVHPDIPYMRCELDGVINGCNSIFEAKHINAFGNAEDAVTKYYPQLAHNMLIASATCLIASPEHAVLSVFHGTQKYVRFTVDLDPFYGEVLLDREHQFWECVKSGEPPVDMPPVPAPTPPEKMRSVSFEGNNSWSDYAGDWLESQTAAKKFEAASAEIKKMIPEDVKIATGHGIIVTRTKSGALTIKPEKK